MKKYILVFSTVLLLMPLLVRAQAILPNAGLTPESPFYFLDRFGEALQEFFTFNPEAKARLQITFAAERVAEIKVILETKGVDAKGLEVAQSRLKTHLTSAATIVTDRKAEGKDVSQLAKELDDEFEAPKTALEQTFKDEKRALEAEEEELKTKIRGARQAGDTAQVEVLVKELGKVKAQKELLDIKKDEQKKALENEGGKIKEEMDAKAKAEKAIREAEEEKQEVMDEAAEEDVTVPAEAFEKFDKLLAQARELFDRGNYQGAKQLAKQAEKSLEKVEEAIEESEKAKEKGEELKEEQEEEKQEAKQEQEKKVKERAKKESENLKEEQKKAKEETKKAEEQLRKESETATVAPKTWTVEYRENQFIPGELKIKKGDIVTWINNSSESVWPASAFHPTHQVYSGFDALRRINTGENYSFTFDKVGNWKYHDHLNPSVTGGVEVSE